MTKDPVVEEISSLLALASEHASDGYHLLSKAESFCNEAYHLLSKAESFCNETYLKLPLVSGSAVLLQANLSIPQESVPQPSTSGSKHLSSPDEAQLIPSSKIHCLSVSMVYAFPWIFHGLGYLLWNLSMWN